MSIFYCRAVPEMEQLILKLMVLANWQGKVGTGQFQDADKAANWCQNVYVCIYYYLIEF